MILFISRMDINIKDIISNKRIRPTAGALFLVVVVFAIVYFVSSSSSVDVSDRFTDARKKAAIVSGDIVRLTNETNDKITQINVLDVKGNTEEALALIQSAKSSNSAAYVKAFELSQNLKSLTESLGDIRSSNNQRVAYEAIAIELSLVSEFISYTQALNVFLDNLSQLIVANTTQNQNMVRSSISSVNEKTFSINNLNRQFLDKMRVFDESL